MEVFEAGEPLTASFIYNVAFVCFGIHCMQYFLNLCTKLGMATGYRFPIHWKSLTYE
jgi:hypothetical protein